MQILWGVLDIIAIVVLSSGVYLWLARRKVPVETRLAELFRRAEAPETRELSPDPAPTREGALT
jgi:uncharacterized iron-regulated membrane protein